MAGGREQGAKDPAYLPITDRLPNTDYRIPNTEYRIPNTEHRTPNLSSSPLHLFTPSPLQLFTSSPLPLITPSPHHPFPSSPLPCQYAPLTLVLIEYSPLLAVMNSVFLFFPPKQTFADQFSGTAMLPSFFPFLSNTVTPFPVR